MRYRLRFLVPAMLAALLGVLLLISFGTEPPGGPSQSAGSLETALDTSGDSVARLTGHRLGFPARSNSAASLPGPLGELRRSSASDTPTHLLVGHVWDFEGRPIAGASVRAYDATGSNQGSGEPFWESLTKVGGAFQLELADPTQIRLEIAALRHAAIRDEAPLLVVGRVERHYRLLDAPHRVEGRVIDAFQQQPLAGAQVELKFDLPLPGGPDSPLMTRTTRTDASGRFTFDDVPAARASVTARHPGYFEDVRSHLHPRGYALVLRLVPGDEYDFVVENRLGQPVAGAQVVRPDGWTTHSDEKGRFHLPLIPELSAILLQVRAPTYSNAFLELPFPPEDRRIVLEPAPEVRGRVLSPQRQPIEGVQVQPLEAPSSHRFWPPAAVTNSRGEFTAYLTDPRFSHLLFLGTGYQRREVEVGEGLSGDLVIVLEEANSAISGRIYGFSPRWDFPLRIMLQKTDGGADSPAAWSVSVANPRGEFLLEGLAAGQYSVWAHQRGSENVDDPQWRSARTRVSVPPGQTVSVPLYLRPVEEPE